MQGNRTSGFSLSAALLVWGCMASGGISRAVGEQPPIPAIESAGSGVLYVSVNAPSGGDGMRWSSAFTHLQEALATARSGCEIRIGQGTYLPDRDAEHPTGSGGRSETFLLENGVTIKGGYAGTGAADPDSRNLAQFATVLSGDIGVAGNAADNSYHVVTSVATDASAVLDGVTITGGNANGALPHNCGGGMFNSSGRPTLINCVFRQNAAAYRGGAVFNEYVGNPTFINCLFGANAAVSGGAINNVHSDPTLKNCTLVGNSASTSDGNENGGGIQGLDQSHTTAVNCILWGNTPQQINNGLSGGSTVITYSCIESGYEGTGNISDDPLLADTVNGDCHLQTGSPCIDTGDSTAADIAVDLDGGPRIVNGAVDMGAYEASPWAIDSIPVIVSENGTGTFTVALRTDPGGPVTVAVTRMSGDEDISVASGGVLAFDPGNFAVPQTVTLAASEDGDYADGTAVVLLHAPGYSDALVAAVEDDNDAAPEFVIMGNPVTVPEGGTATCTVALTVAPQSPIQVSVGPASGDGSISVQSGGSLTFDSGNFAVPQTVTLAAAEDADFLNGVATIPVSAEGFPDAIVSVLEDDNDAPAARLYVKAGATGQKTGLSWTDALTNLQDALDGAAASDGVVSEIWVAEETYVPSRRTDTLDPRSATFQLLNGVALYGGFAGTETNLGQRNPKTHVTTLSGDLEGNDGPDFANNGENCYHVVTGSGTDASAILNGFAISGGNADKAVFGGAGMFNYAGSPMVADCVFTGNSAVTEGYVPLVGAAMHSRNGSDPAILRCDFVGNRANACGGIYHTGSSPFVANCTFVNNAGISGNCGAIYFGSGNATVTNCLFLGNSGYYGAGIFVSGTGYPSITNCTFVANTAQYSGGGLHGDDAVATLRNCIVWGNTGGQITPAGAITVLHSCVQNGYAGTGNISNDPLFVNPAAGDYRLQAGSPCIDAGNSGAVVVGVDLLGNRRRWDDAGTVDTGVGGAPVVDMGPYEFGSTAVPARLYVDAGAAGAQTGLDWTDSFSDLQAALMTALVAGGRVAEVWVADGMYRPAGPDGDRTAAFRLVNGVAVYGGFAGGETELAARNPATHPAILSGDLNANDGPDFANNGENSFHVVTGGGADPSAVLDGFTIRGGNADGGPPYDRGAGIYLATGRPTLRNILLSGNSASAQGGGIYSDVAALQVCGVTVGDNAGPTANAGVISRTRTWLEGVLSLTGGTPQTPSVLSVRGSSFEGPGSLNLGADTLLQVSDAEGDDPTVFRSNIAGTGDIRIEAGQELTVGGTAIVDLSDGAGTAGKITILGTLIAQDAATVRNTNIDVLLADITDGADIQYNNIFLLDTAGFGGQFFVEGGASVAYNVITSEGDRYLDLDPHAGSPNPNITGNQITVIIKEGTTVNQGTLLELRARDYDCAQTPCPSGAFELADSAGYSDTWVLEGLRIEANAKLNLTNRQGFDFNGPSEPDTVYVKTLTLYPDAVLNVAGQRLYYRTLRRVDSDGNPVENNGSTITDIPLLGFSLGIIAMNDATEFDVRIRKRLTDPQDFDPARPNDPLPEGAVGLVPDARGTGDGVMAMQTRSASSVAAKGQFARAGEAEIVVAFEYQFIDAGPDTRLLVKLSDDREPGTANVTVAALRPPAAGRAGSVGSTSFGIFTGTFPRGTLDFARHTWVELELQGAGSLLWIDNWDPQILCSYNCGEFAGRGISEADYLLLLAEAGQVIPDSNHDCLDMTGDGYVDHQDVLLWDAFFDEVLNICPYQSSQTIAATATARQTDVTSSGIPEGLIIAGKPRDCVPVSEDECDRYEFLYSYDPVSGCAGESGLSPAGGPGSQGNGRLIKAPDGTLYQIYAAQGLVKLNDLSRDDDNEVVVAPHHFAAFQTGSGTAAVEVGVTQADGSLPLADVVFSPSTADTIYVVPVLVTPSGEVEPYKAAARLLLTGGGEFTLQAVYGVADDPESDVHKQHVREIEIDRSGQFLFVTSAHAARLQDNRLLNNDWILVYDVSAGGAEILAVALHDLATPVNGPTAMLASVREDVLYLSASVNPLPDAKTQVFRFAIDRNETGAVTALPQSGAAEITNPVNAPDNQGLGFSGTITSIQEDPTASLLYVMGYTAPKFAWDAQANTGALAYDAPLFATPCLAVVSCGMTGPGSAVRIDCHGLAMPASAVLAGHLCQHPQANLDGDTDVDGFDFLTFANCFNGSDRQPLTACENTCSDLDRDGDVDGFDFLTFANCYNGSDRPPLCD